RFLYDREKMYDQAVSAMRDEARVDKEFALAENVEAIYRKSGYEHAKQYYLAAKIEKAVQEKSPAFFIATLYANMGDTTKELVYLEQAYRRREGINRMKVTPDFAGLRSEPRFQQVLKNMTLSN